MVDGGTSQISKPALRLTRIGFELMHNLSSDSVEGLCAAMIKQTLILKFMTSQPR